MTKDRGLILPIQFRSFSHSPTLPVTSTRSTRTESNLRIDLAAVLG